MAWATAASRIAVRSPGKMTRSLCTGAPNCAGANQTRPTGCRSHGVRASIRPALTASTNVRQSRSVCAI